MRTFSNISSEDKLKKVINRSHKNRHASLYLLVAFYKFQYIRDGHSQAFETIKEFSTFMEALKYKHKLEYRKNKPRNNRVQYYWIYPFL